MGFPVLPLCVPLCVRDSSPSLFRPVFCAGDLAAKFSTLLSQCKRIEKRVFPKHEAMCDTFEREISKSNTQVRRPPPLSTISPHWATADF